MDGSAPGGRKPPPRLPVLFVGHGSPTNALENNSYTRALERLGRELPRPRAILCVSAHWSTPGNRVTHMPRPRTIHDFYGFPKELFELQYPAPGAPGLAEELAAFPGDPPITLDNDWGLDHGCWAVLMRMYPQADVPVVQLSLEAGAGPHTHFRLGEKLRAIREKGILLLGSGNIVHNLREIRWEADAAPHSWAVEFDEWVKARLEQRDYQALLREALASPAGKRSHPSAEHLYPLFVALGASHPDDALRFEHEGIQNASISMRCVSLGA